MSLDLVLAGNLKFLSLADILQLLSSIGSTGVLRLSSPHLDMPGMIYLQKGNPVDAEDGSQKGLEALTAMFGWLDADFEFSLRDHKRPRRIRMGPMEVILDGLRMLDEGLLTIIGPTSETAEKAKQRRKPVELPVIKGPMVDYLDIIDEESFADGRVIVEEGNQGNWAWVILEGQVEIVKNSAHGPLSLVRISEGAFIGGLATFQMGGTLRSASNIAVGDVQLGVLDSQAMTVEYSTLSPMLKAIALSLEKRLRMATETAASIYEGDNRVRELAEGKNILVKQGQRSERLYYIKQGQAVVVRQTQDGFIPLAVLGPRDFFGHVPFLEMGQEPYSASVLGSVDIEYESIDVDVLKEEFDGLKPTVRNIIQNSAICLLATGKVACDYMQKAKQRAMRVGRGGAKEIQ